MMLAVMTNETLNNSSSFRINVTLGLNICKMVRKTELKVHLSHFSSSDIASYFIYTDFSDLVSSLLNPGLDDSRLTLIHVAGAYDTKDRIHSNFIVNY